MICSKTAYTFEIDDTRIAVEELLAQLAPLALAPGMAGIVACACDFVESGVVQALAEALPFELIGETTISQAVPGESGQLMLTLMVLYAEDCRFAGGVTAPISSDGDLNAGIESSYREAAARLGEPVKLIVAFPPLLNARAGDDYVGALSELAGRVPVFGSICADDQADSYAGAQTLYAGQAYSDRMSFLLISGAVDPRFYIASISNESRLPYRGEITASNGPVLMGVNGLRIVDYLETIGLAEGGRIRSGINSIPFLISFDDAGGKDDGVPVARAMFMITPENYALCGGRMPEKAGITVGVCDKEDVLRTTREIIRLVGTAHPGRTVLMHSCLGRRLALGADPLLEVSIAAREMAADTPFMLSYSSGEICPTSCADGVATNRFHNYTFVACVL